jgi:hypothetical protein
LNEGENHNQLTTHPTVHSDESQEIMEKDEEQIRRCSVRQRKSKRLDDYFYGDLEETDESSDENGGEKEKGLITMEKKP